MKRFLPTFVLVVLCVAGFWYASNHSFFQKKTSGPSKLMAEKEQDIQAITIQSKQSLVELQKQNNKWVMMKPTAIPVDSNAVTAWLDTITSLTAKKTVDEHPANVTKYGLAKPIYTFTVQLSGGTSKMLDVGGTLPIPGYDYGKLDDAAMVYQLDDTLVKQLEKGALDFQNNRAVDIPLSKIKSMNLHWKNGSWKLTRASMKKGMSESDWELNGKKIKTTQATDLLNQLLYLNTSELVQPAAEKNKIDTSFRLDIITVDQGKETNVSYEGQMDQSNIWIKKKGAAWAYAIPLKTIQQLYDQGVKDLPK